MKNKKDKKGKVIKTKKNKAASVKKSKPSPAKSVNVKIAKKAKAASVKPPVKKKEIIPAKKIQAEKVQEPEMEMVTASTPERRPLTEQEKKIKALMIKKNKKDDNSPRIKLRIDSRTIITVKSKEALKMWKDKYPNAVEVD